MGQCPAEAREEGGGNDENEAKDVEGCFACDHHYDADCHGSDDEDELYGWCFEAEDKSEKEDEG